MKNKIFKFLFFLFIILILLEVLLRSIGLYKTKHETSFGKYVYFFSGEESRGWLHSNPPNTLIHEATNEFVYDNKYNEFGHREISVDSFINHKGFKIIAIGDSYTQGDGVAYEYTWVKALEKKCNDSLKNNTLIYNAGVNGSDVFFNNEMLKQKLLPLKPNLVIECINRSDILDVYYRGGQERFCVNNKLCSPNKKWWEPLFKYSHNVRAFLNIFFKYDKNLIKIDKFREIEEKGVDEIISQISKTQAICKEEKIDYLLLVIPNVNSLQFSGIFDTIDKKLPQQISSINVYDCMLKEFQTKDIKKYSWKENKHYNSEGYMLLSNFIWTQIISNKTVFQLFRSDK